MKIYISQDTGSIYWLEGDALMFAPINRNHTTDTTEGAEVEEHLVGDEHIYDPHKEPLNFKTFSELYAEVRKALKAK